MRCACRTAISLKPGVRFLRETITAIDPAARRVTTDRATYEADHLVVALGAEYDFAATPGLSDVNESIRSRARKSCATCCRISSAAAR